ncbi:MAG: HlyC/CorC family transporter [Chloroflexi bacterium]|nr:HlyC/CorC family transporter [Chloroflexota bacterium]
METDSYLLIGITLLCLIVAAAASVAETALMTISRVRVRHLIEEGLTKAQAIEKLLSQPTTVLSTIVIVNSIAIIGAASLATYFSLKYLPADWSLVVAVVATSLVVLVFCEVIPKTFAVQNPERSAMLVAGPVRVLSLVLSPLIGLLGLMTNAVLSLIGAPRVQAPLVSEEELKLYVNSWEEQGIIEEEEKEMIDSIIELEDTAVREIMVPRIDIVAVDTDATLPEAVKLVIQRGYSRIPLYEESIDNIVGVVYAKDLLRFLIDSVEIASLREVARPAQFVPETKKVDELLRELQQKRIHLAIVVDEYGGTAGLVTIEDLVEEIVGEIQDEYDSEEAEIEKVSDLEAILHSKASISELEDLFGNSVEADDFDTVGGFVYNQLGKIPSPGDEIRVDDLTLTVLSTVGRRIKQVRVVKDAGGKSSGGDQGKNQVAKEATHPPDGDQGKG